MNDMIRMGTYEVRTHLARLLAEVERGSSVVITRHGREIARLVPAPPDEDSTETVIDDLLRARKGTRRGPESVRSMIDEGRR